MSRPERPRGWSWWQLVLLVGLLGLMLAPVVRAETLEERTRQIAKQLQCPVCESVSVADSPSALAGQMRGVIHEKLAAGESEEQVIQYFVDRYGDQVLLEPPKRGLSLAVWWAPVLILAGGAALLWVVLRSWLVPVGGWRLKVGSSSKPPPPISHLPPPTSEYDQRAQRELERFRREVGG